VRLIQKWLNAGVLEDGNRIRVGGDADILRRLRPGSICCYQSAVAMRVCAGLASSKLTLLPRSGTTSRTTDGEDLFWAEFRFHCEIMPQPPAKMVNSEQFENDYLLGLIRYPRLFGDRLCSVPN
jgi:hypothetical protein